jgi:uncharacterized protein YjeT (DUF2065 family)
MGSAALQRRLAFSPFARPGLRRQGFAEKPQARLARSETMRAMFLALALALVLAGLGTLAAPAAACHPFHIEQIDVAGVTIYYWIDKGCPHTIPFVCVVVAPPVGPPSVPICV